MKKYQVNVHYDAVITVPDIIAESEEEAIAIAKQRAATQSLNEAEVVDNNACVTREEDVPEKKTKSLASELSDEQLELLDEFVAAAGRLNEAGVSLFWNDDDNALAVVNRDAMQDCDFFEQDNEEIASNPESKSVYDNLTASLEVEINYISEEQDYLFFPKKD